MESPHRAMEHVMQEILELRDQMRVVSERAQSADAARQQLEAQLIETAGLAVQQAE